MKVKRPELVAPAGDLEKLKVAIVYGADSVYIGGKEFGLRKYAGNFDFDSMKEGIEFAHRYGKKVYLTANIFARNEDIKKVDEFFDSIKDLGFDGIIVSDLGIFKKAKRLGIPIHISTQANTTNFESARFWYELGAKRIVLARELSLEEIKEIRQNVPQDLELEAFVHGAVCISYSGRCFLSAYMTYRDANRGECAHPCRYKYYIMEEKRPGQYFEVFEDVDGTYIFNSKDLCMVEHIDKLVKAGIDAFKIEGRMKSSFYVGTVVSVYRKAIDRYLQDPEHFEVDPQWLEEIAKCSHRSYTTNFYFGKPTHNDYKFDSSKYIREYEFIGIVKEVLEDGWAVVEQRNRFFRGDVAEVMLPDGTYFVQKLDNIFDLEGNPLDVVPHAQQLTKIKFDKPVVEFAMLRKKVEE
ncbi:U32 family peptidase [Caldicellulosiruptor changbaiensis]|uniref:U32 family peptidase n=1 Tax=Caldicellulosiruptor changbaiensis TaxID=1222016 RepID=A0A3T0D7I3_9FIRM|nr:U32 family peptidase [Caldicellulosiruptor changbaiensis]AZT91023.1 U32 family peptidase [Caldicellulosiruptor changbaiensis]